jgi:hypothetical protein
MDKMRITARNQRSLNWIRAFAIVGGDLKKADMGTRGEIFSSKANTTKRTYFFNVKENRTGDVFLNIVESRKMGEDVDRFERRSLIVFKEDLDVFLQAFDKAVRFIRRK